MRCLVLDVAATATSGATLTVSTEVTGWRRVWARRRSEILGSDGKVIAVVTTDWVLLGPSGGPVRVPAAILDAFPTPLPDFQPERVALAATPPGARMGMITVRRQELDPLGHANHAVYADWLEETVAGAAGEATLTAMPRVMRLEFIRAATLGTTVTSAVWPSTHGAWACRLTDPTGAELLRATVGPVQAADDLGKMRS